MVWNPQVELVEGEIHKDYLRLAYSYASEHSEDSVTRTGAVIVNPDLNEILAYGTNHFPKGLVPTLEQIYNRQWKYEHIIHAEPAAIFSAAKAGKSTEGTTMYMPWVPCTPCAKAIIDAGIKTLVGHKDMIMKTPERWWESTNYALNLLERCGVKRLMLDVEIGGVKNLFDGSEWSP